MRAIECWGCKYLDMSKSGVRRRNTYKCKSPKVVKKKRRDVPYIKLQILLKCPEGGPVFVEEGAEG